MAITTAPPISLTMEEYRRDWQPQGWQLIIIGPTSTWRQEWGTWEAIRDIVQNALDEAESYTWGYDDKGLWIADSGRGIAVENFLLGPPRLKPEWARGKYGEGMKIAALVMLRDGISVHIKTVAKEIWIVFIEQKVNGPAHTLAALWRSDGTAFGTRFHFIGYKGSAYEDRFAVNLPVSSILATCPSKITQPRQRYNQLIWHDFPEGSRIYARDIYMRNIDSPYSYNLWSFELAPDRHASKSEFDLWVDMGRLWCHVRSVNLLESFLKMIHDPPILSYEESRSINMDRYSMGTIPDTTTLYADKVKENASQWRRAWENNFGKNAVIRTHTRWDNIVKHLGYESHSVQWTCQGTLEEVILSDMKLIKKSQDRLRQAEIIPDDKLNNTQRAHLKLARGIAEDLAYVSPKVSGIYAAIIPPASDRVRTAGMYSRVTEEIYISLDQLDRAGTTIDTLIHELAHHTSGVEDLEEGHANHMTKIAAMVVELTHAGEFDNLMEGVIW